MLLTLTLIITAAVVLVLAVSLIAIAYELIMAKRNVAAIADGLEAVAVHTKPLANKLTTINDALGQLLEKLERADGHLLRVAKVFRLT